MLSRDQTAFYRDNGYLLVEDVFSETELAELNRVTGALVEAARAVPASNALYDLAPEHSAEDPRVRRIKHPQQHDPAYAAAARSQRLLDILECLIGPAIRFDHGKLNIKPAGGGGAIEWHQDWAFYPQTNDDMLAVGVMLEDCTPDNGPLLVIPGSHKGPVYDHHHEGVFVGGVDPGDLGAERERAVALTGKAGSCTIHHVRSLHGSRENRSGRPRPLLLFSYVAVDAWPLIKECDIAEFDSRILRGAPTLEPRQVALPVRLPLPRVETHDSIFDNQDVISGRSFGPSEAPAVQSAEAT